MLGTLTRMRNLVLAALLLAIGEAVPIRKGTIVTAPNRLIPGKKETICVTFTGDITDASITCNLTSTEAENSSQLISQLRFNSNSGDVTCGKILLPKNYSQETVKFSVEVNAHDYKFAETKQLSVFTGGSEFTLIQTDKPVYKPGQAVKMRIMTLTTDLIPVINNRYDVWIEDPSGVRVEQWLDVATTKGLAQLEFMLNSEPPLGKWSITCKSSMIREKAFFLVQEYVLPRFEVNIRAPKSISRDDEFISGEVCASYTYGQPVKGATTVEFLAKRFSWERSLPETIKTYVSPQIIGCAKFNQTAIDLDLRKGNDYGLGRQLEIRAFVTEQGTGVVVNASAVTVEIEFHKANIVILADDNYKPGLNHSGKVVVTSLDGRPLAEQLVNIVVRNEQFDNHLLIQRLTDGNGEVAYVLPTPGEVIHEYVIEATLMSENEANDWRRPRTTKLLNPWYSPSGSYIQLQAPAAGGRLPCGQEAHISLHYTTNESRDVDLIMQVSGLNDIVLSTLNKVRLERQQQINWASSNYVANKPEQPNASRKFSKRSIHYMRDRTTSKNVRPSHHGYTTLSINVTSLMAPIARLLVFYTTPDGEIVADALNLEVEKCTPNKVNISFNSSVVRPGEEVGLLLTAAPQSLCAYGTVDKSVYLLGGENQLNADRLYGQLESYMNSPETDINKYREETSYCERQHKKTTSGHSGGDEGNASPLFEWYPWWRVYSSMYKDASHAFQTSAATVLTDLKLDTRPCSKTHPRGIPLMSMADDDDRSVTSNHKRLSVDSAYDDTKDAKSVYKPIVEVRTYFPETWLWDIVEMGESGQVNLPLNAPHTITEWKGSATCIHETEGFGVSQVTSMKVFQPFFVSVELPYAVIRRENVSITATVYNYHSEPLSVNLNLKKSADFHTSFSSTKIICICPKDSKSHGFSLVPTKLGGINITVLSVSTESPNCSNECNTNPKGDSIVGFRDALVKQLLVHPEGMPRQYTNSSYVCLQPGRENEWRNYTLALPRDLINQSQRAYVSVIGDVMGPSLSNLDNLLQMPWGCGEQNMLGFAPNIYVMQYLEATRQASDAIRTKATGYMKSGYQRQMTYSHPDRSYSAFGTSDREGSIWLTAFVVKCFAQARQFIYIDESHLAGSIGYFGKHQTYKGCFLEVGKVIHKGMKGGLADANDVQGAITLTAYIAISLLEAEDQHQETMVKNAFKCLDSQDVTDPYSVALFSYAYSLYNVSADSSIRYLKKLQSMAVREGDTVYWRAVAPTVLSGQSNVSQVQYQKPTAADVETTAYALLALLRHNATIEDTLPVVRWLTLQRNPSGGFYSTQDTILAIQALAKFAAKTYVADFNMSVVIEDGQKRVPLNVNNMNSLQLQSTSLELKPEKPTSLAVRFSGNGCALVQANVRYNVALTATFRSGFVTHVKTCQSVEAAKKQNSCKKQTLEISTRYNGTDAASNMAIVDVNMVSGWVADKDSIRLLQSNRELGLKRFEINERTVSLYFEQITKQGKLFKFDVLQEQKVENTKRVTVTTYDYYNPDMRHETHYNLNTTTCSTDSCSGMNNEPSMTKRSRRYPGTKHEAEASE